MTKTEIIELLDDVAIELELCNGSSTEVKNNLEGLINFFENSKVQVLVCVA